jgi:ribokinase
MPEPRIVVVGSSNTDLIVQTSRLPAAGETVLGGDLVTAAGGKGANQAVAAARLGATVTFVGRTGRDMFGERTLRALQREGMDLDYFEQDLSAPSGVALIVVGPGGQNLIAVAPGANNRVSPGNVQSAARAFEGCRVVLLQLEVPMPSVVAAARAGRQAGATVILNPAPAMPIDDQLFGLVDIMTPNEHEAAALTGTSDPEAAAQALLTRGAGAVIVTLGEAGILLAQPGQASQRWPAFRVEAVDTTAAGDAFNGGLAAALARGQPLPTAARYAQAVAALSVTRLGAQPSLPYAMEVDAFLEAFEHTRAAGRGSSHA